MYDMSRRLKKVESKLNVGRRQIVVIIDEVHSEDEEGFDLSNPIEQWLTYPEALERAPEQNGIIVLNKEGEIQARRAAAAQSHGAARQ